MAIFDKKNQFGLDPDNPLGNVPAAYNEMYPFKKWEDLEPEYRDQYVSFCTTIWKKVDTLNQAANPYGADFTLKEWRLYIDFSFPDQMEDKVASLFKEFNEKIRTSITPKEKRVLIANLFQKLEWRHAPKDGTTRTDLIILNVLLCKYGFNPVILPDPSRAAFLSLDEGVSYLEQGMETWKAEKSKEIS